MTVVDRWKDPIDEITSAFKMNFGKLSNEELNWKPNPKSWSIAQNIDHLIIINGTYYQKVEALRNDELRLPAISKLNFLVKFIGKTILNAVKPDRKKRIRTFDIWEPAYTLIDSGILVRFENDQRALKELIHSSAALLSHNAVISSPANQMLVLRLETAFDIIVSHEQRHLEQAKEVLAGLKAHHLQESK